MKRGNQSQNDTNLKYIANERKMWVYYCTPASEKIAHFEKENRWKKRKYERIHQYWQNLVKEVQVKDMSKSQGSTK